MRTRAWRGALAAAAVAALAIILLHGYLERLATASLAGHFIKARVSIGAMHLGTGRATLQNVVVRSPRGEPLATIKRIDVAYSLHDLMRGTGRRYGLRAISIVQPSFTIIRRIDGSYNLPQFVLPKSSGKSAPAPLIFTGAIRDGSLTLINESSKGSPLHVDHVNASLAFDTRAKSTYRMSFTFEDANRRYPVSGVADIDETRGYMLQHFTAAVLPIAHIANYFISSPDVHVDAGALRSLDLRYYGLGSPHGTMPGGIAATALLDRTQIRVKGMRSPIRDIHGRLDVSSNGITTQSVTATAGGTPVALEGAIYDLKAPQLDLTVDGRGDLAVMRRLSPYTETQPVAGPVAFRIKVEGSVKNPLTAIAMSSPQIAYRGFAVSAPRALVAVAGHEADMLAVRAGYGEATLNAQGRFAFKRGPDAVAVVARIAAPPDGFPYVSQIAPGMSVAGTVFAAGDGPKTIAVRGYLTGSSPSSRLETAFALDPHGNGTVGPLAFSGSGGSFSGYATVRSYNRISAIAGARHLTLPGMGATIDGRVAVAYAGGATIAQLDGARVSVPALRGIAIDSASATIALRGKNVDVYDAQAAVNGGHAVASGGIGAGRSLAVSAESVPLAAMQGLPFQDGVAHAGAVVTGSPGAPSATLALLLDGAHLRHYAVGGDAAVAYAGGNAQIQSSVFTFENALLDVNGNVGGIALGAPLAPSYDLTVALRGADVGQLVAVAKPQLAKLALVGSADADLHVGGAGTVPSVAGTVSLPEGSIHGLALRDLTAAIAGTQRSAAFRNGHVIVGGTAVAFDATTGGSTLSGALRAPKVDLADFNDYFDSGDTLAGVGSLRATLADANGTLASSGSVGLQHARYKRFPLGTASATWYTSGQIVHLNGGVGGRTGRLALAGTVALARSSSAAAIARDSDFDLGVSAQHIDLGSWLPLLGFNSPVTGYVDGAATVDGRYPNLDLSANASVVNGMFGRLPVTRFEVAATATRGHARLQSAIVQVPHFTATASGTFGLHARDAIAIQGHAVSDDVGALLQSATGKNENLAGALDTHFTAAGTRAQPQLGATVALTGVRYRKLVLPHAHATLAATLQTLTIRQADVDFSRGRATLGGSIPFQLRPFGIRSAAALALRVTAQDVELSNFAALLPQGTKVGGRIDGALSARGTDASPDVQGALALSNGSFSGPMLASPLTNLAGRLAFAGPAIALQNVRGKLGGGIVAASGRAMLANLHDPRSASGRFQLTATNANVDAPKYFKGVVNADVVVARAAGARPMVTGTIAIPTGRLPLSAFLTFSKKPQGTAVPPDIGFNVAMTAGRDVRVQGPEADIGVKGAATLAGTLASPSLNGQFHSTGGTVSLYRTFDVQHARVAFTPSDGVMPEVNAVATTQISDPNTFIRMHVTGLVPNMTIAFSSDPSYDRSQILGLLVGAQALGAVPGVAATGGGSFSASYELQSLALGQVSQELTRNLFEPLSAQLGQALGLGNLQLTDSFTGGFGIRAAKAFGKSMNVQFSESFGVPIQEMLSLNLHLSRGAVVQLMTYQQQDMNLLSTIAPVQPSTASLAMNAPPIPPMMGSNGFRLSYEHRF